MRQPVDVRNHADLAKSIPIATSAKMLLIGKRPVDFRPRNAVLW
jgi:hypothetical protein